MNKEQGKNLIQILKTSGFSITKGRVLILKVLLKAKLPMTASGIHKKIGKKHTNLATVYRSLNSLVKSKLVSRTDFDDGSSRYEINEASTSHHHFIVCRECKDMLEINDVCNLNKYEEKIKATTGFKDIEHRVAFYGICEKCN